MPYTMFIYNNKDVTVPKIGDYFIVQDVHSNVLDYETGERGTHIDLVKVEVEDKNELSE